MAISEVHHVALGVRDLARSIEFYRDVLGFKVSLEIRADDAAKNARLLETPPGTRMRSAMLRKAHGTVGQIELIQFDPPLVDGRDPARAGDRGPFLLSFEVTGEDLEQIAQRLAARGVRCHGKPERVDIAGYGRIGALVFRDPDGVMIELVELPR
jgi:catechol 2,3-dioxygenase-like lactoylglutathione lyase family enzyme